MTGDILLWQLLQIAITATLAVFLLHGIHRNTDPNGEHRTGS